MKYLLLSLLSFTTAISVYAQNFQPLQLNRTYQFALNSGADSLYTLKVESASVVNGDSVFVLNKVWKKMPSGWQSNNPNCGFFSSAGVNVSRNNVFGERMIKKSNGDFQFITAENDTFLLRSQAPSGTSWNFGNTPVITATYQGQSQQIIQGANTDLVKSFSLSNGHTIKLSQNYGFVETPSFSSFSDTTEILRQLSFHSLPEKGLGSRIASPLSVFDFMPGDKFRYYGAEIYDPGMTNCRTEWIIDSVISRTNYPSGDSVSYQIQHQRLTYLYGIPGTPSGMGCTYQTDTFLTAPVIRTITYGPRQFPVLTQPVRGYAQAGQGGNWTGSHAVLLHQIKKTNYNNRLAISTEDGYLLDTCNQGFGHVYDYGSRFEYGLGLGLVHLLSFGMFSNYELSLQAYVKGTETYGVWTSLNSILRTESEITANTSISVSPNPFTTSFNFTATAAHPQNATITLYNLLGQPVLQRNWQLRAGNQQLEISASELPTGLYQVHLKTKEKTQTLKIVKAE